MVDSTQIAELSKELMVANEQFKFASQQEQLAKNQLKKTEVTMTEVDKVADDKVMYRSLGRLFLQIKKEQCLTELGENKKTLEDESKKYEDLRTTYK